MMRQFKNNANIIQLSTMLLELICWIEERRNGNESED